MYAPHFSRPSHTREYPDVAAKALELFLAMIVQEASKVTLERSAKKVEAYHLCVSAGVSFTCGHLMCFFWGARKHAVETTEMLDFLKEIVESVPDPSAGGTIDLEAEAAEGSKRKRGKSKKNGALAASGEPKKRRKKKADVDMDGPGEEAGAGAKSEPEGDTAMEEDEDGHVESSHRDQDAGWRDDEDAPYVPR